MSLTHGKRQSVTGKTQADGAQIFELDPGHHIHQIQFKPSASPSAGTMTFSLRTPGASDYVTVDTMDLTDVSEYLVSVTGFGDSLKCEPASFDALKTYSLFVMSGNA
jgi:hypothetical protein